MHKFTCQNCAQTECVCVCVCAKPNTGNFNQSFFTPTNRVCTGGLSYADVITKFSVIDRFPFSFRYEAPIHCARGPSSTKNIIMTVMTRCLLMVLNLTHYNIINLQWRNKICLHSLSSYSLSISRDRNKSFGRRQGLITCYNLSDRYFYES